MTRLSVNLNKIALLRNSRGGAAPSVIDAARIAVDAGAHGITVHPRPDGRHIRKQDIYDLRETLDAEFAVEFNIEGYPAEAFMEMVLEVKPDQCTLVPDTPDQLTSDHGWDVLNQVEFLRPVIARLKEADIRVSLFVDPDVLQIQCVASIGADRIELYTEAYARAYAARDLDHTLAHYIAAASAAGQHNLGVNAGHDLNRKNLTVFLSEVPNVLEVSIGHALISEAIFEEGLSHSVRKYLDAIRDARSLR